MAFVVVALGGQIILGQNPTIDEIFNEQSDLNRCGPYALHACASFIGTPVGREDLARYIPNDGQITTFKQLADAAQALGFDTIAVRWKGRPTLPRSAPAILAVTLNGNPHFVVAVGIRDDRVLIIDMPDAGWMPYRQLRDDLHWKGEALHVAQSKWPFTLLYTFLYWREVALGSLAVVTIILLMWRRWSLRERRGRHLLRRAVHVMAFVECISFIVGCGRERRQDIESFIRIEPESISLDASRDANAKGECDAVLHVINDSPDPVRIRQIVADCGCTALGEPTAKLLGRGEHSDVPIRVQLPGTGVKRSRVAILVEAGRTQQTLIATILMRGRPILAPAIISAPKEVLLARDAEGKANAAVVVRTYERSGSKPWIARAIADEGIVSIAYSGMTEVDSPEPNIKVRHYTYSLSASKGAGDVLKKSDSTVLIGLTSEGNGGVPVAEFYARVKDWDPVHVVPEAIFAEGVAGAKVSIAREVRVVFCDKTFQPTSVEAIGSAPWIHVISSKLDSDKSQAFFELQLSEQSEGGVIRGDLKINILYGDHADSLEEIVPIIVKTRSSA